MDKNKPLIILKQALSLNGYLDNVSPVTFSNVEDQGEVQILRSKVDAILVGSGTIINDNPNLVVKNSALVKLRLENNKSKQPLRIVITGIRKIPKNSNIFTDTYGKPLIICNEINKSYYSEIADTITYNEKLNLQDLLVELKDQNLNTVLVEGGAKIAQKFLENKLVDIMRLAYTSKIISNNEATKLNSNTSIMARPIVKRLDNMYSVYYCLKESTQTANFLL